MLIQFVKKIIPKKYIPKLIKLRNFIRGKIYLIIYSGNRYTCSFCNYSFRKFLSGGLNLSVLKKNKIIGGGHRLNVFCPHCMSSDRERLINIFLKKNNLVYSKMKLLHVAPEATLQTFLGNKNINYFSADLNPELAKIKMDIRNIQFPTNYFDAIICNHVLEHIIEDKQAMKELHRVLKPKGWAILQVPYSPNLTKTFEDLSVRSEEEREKIFGQKDHVRIYGVDYTDFLRSTGFKVELKKLSKKIIKQFAINPREQIFFCKKEPQ